jgi:hypothetical protein
MKSRIWFEEEYDRPDGTAHLVCSFNPKALPPDSVIAITLHLWNAERIRIGERTLYSHNLAIGHEEPTNEDLVAKYRHKLVKAGEYVLSHTCHEMAAGGRSPASRTA